MAIKNFACNGFLDLLFQQLIYFFLMLSVVQEVIKMQSAHHLLEPVLEPLIRRVVCVFPW